VAQLHKTTGEWKMDGAPLGIYRNGRAWILGADLSEVMRDLNRIDELTDWLKRNALYAVEFRSRREALRAAQAALSVDPLAAITPARLVRARAGEYHTPDGCWLVRRRGKCWEIIAVSPQPGMSAPLSGGYETLHEAALMIAASES